MRIVDEWNEQDFKMTVFIMNGRYSLKVENKLLEQTYKFRDSQIESLDQLKSLLSPSFFTHCKNTFIRMDLERSKLFPASSLDNEFPEII